MFTSKQTYNLQNEDFIIVNLKKMLLVLHFQIFWAVKVTKPEIRTLKYKRCINIV